MEENYITDTVAKEQAEIILFNLRQAGWRVAEYGGIPKDSGVLTFSDLEALDEWSTTESIKSDRIVTHDVVRAAAELQAEVLWRVQDPEDSKWNVYRTEVSRIEALYGEDRVGREACRIKAAYDARSQTAAYHEDFTPKNLGTLTFQLYALESRHTLDLGVYEHYERLGLTHQIEDETAFSDIPRPVTVAVVYKDQRADIDVNYTMEINPKHKAKRALRDSLTALTDRRNREKRKEQATLQKLLREVFPLT